MEGTVKLESAAAMLALLLGAHAAIAADTTPAPEVSKDPVIERYRAASERQDWKSAVALMQEAVTKDPRNADYHNLYAYSLRKSGTGSMDLVFKHYDEALRIDPKHRGAREYLGEAYLQVGNVAKAKEQLAALDKLCFFGCEEYDDLKKAIAAHERN
jgi:tetratricopeptide (TPR) repeat protein